MSRPELRLEEGTPLRCLLSLPPGPAPPGAARPVLCFLHGYDEGAPMPIHDALTRHGPLRPGNPPRVVEDFIVVAPQLPTRGDLWYRYADVVRRIVTEVREAHGGDPRRTYLTGFSFGGNGVFDLALLHPGFWAALWAVDPTRVPVEAPRSPVWLSVGEVARYAKQGFVRALRLSPAGDAPAGDRLYLDEGADHVGSATLAYRDHRIYSWLLARPDASIAPGGPAT